MRFSPRFLSLLFWLGGVVQAAPDVFVAYPEPNYRVAFDHVILEGSVTPGATLTVDGKAVATGPDGLFMEWWPLKVGVNDLKLVSSLGGQTGNLTLRVTRTAPPAFSADKTGLDRASVQPRLAYEFWDAANDGPAERSIPVSFNGSPGGRAVYRLGGGSVQAMKEGPSGTYTAAYVLPPSARVQKLAFTVSLTGRDGKTVTAVAPGRVTSTAAGTRLGTQKPGSVQGLGLNEAAVVTTDLQGEPLLYPRGGMTFTLVGRVGNDVRARLAPGLSTLITATQLNISAGVMAAGSGGALSLPGAVLASLPPASPTPAPAVPDTSDPAAGLEVPTSPNPYEVPLTVPPDQSSFSPTPADGPPTPPKTALIPSAPNPSSDLKIAVPLGGARLPFTIRQEDGGRQLTLTLYGKLKAPLTPPTASDPLLNRVDIRTVGLNATELHLHLNGSQAWGFNANYEGPDLVVTVRRAPILNAAQPLAGRNITVDPGHGGSQKGGAGSLRVPEKNIVLPIAQRVAQLLRGLGANVTLTRTGDVTLGLYERALVAENTRADLLVSIHANALPDGRDPRGIRGPEVHYTHPQAEAVSAAILAQLRARLPELDAGAGLFPDENLALTRPSTQISLLVETAYLTDAGNLRVLMSPGGRERFAQAIAGGIADFYAAQVPSGQ